MLVTGSRLGPYEIVAPIGAGGMGEVFRARDTRLDRSVAIKVVSQEFAARFEREARAISALNHPHICTLYDVGRENGTDYLVMELIEGESLADRLLKGPLPLDAVLRYGAQIAAALDRAHKAGVIHRDLKPGNIMLTKSGAKLLDFGLAKGALAPVAVVSEATAATEHKPLTREGTILGTFQYMAPEQLEGHEADARTDIFALGCVLYEMATGRRAFEGKTRTSLIAAIVSSQPTPIAQLQPLTPPALEHVIERCLSKDPDDRWQTAHDIAEELKWIGNAGSQAGVAAPLITKRRSRERLLWLAALIAAVVATAAILVKLRPREERVSYRFLLPQQGAGYTRATWPLLSPDGTRVAFYARNAERQRRLFVRRLDDFTFTSFAVPEGITGTAFWSPDSQELASAVRGRTLVRMNVNNGSVQTIGEVPVFQNGAWGEDGTILLGNNDGPLMMVRATGGQATPITKPDRSKFELGHHAPVFLPGGKRFLFISFTRDPSKPSSPHALYAGELGSREIRKIGEVTSKVSYARGFLFYVRGGSLVAVPFDEKKLAITGEPVIVTNDVAFFQPTGSANYSVSSDGTVAWMPRPQGNQLVLVDASGISIASIGEKGDLRGARVSYDGTRVVVGKRDLASGTFDLWMYGVTRPTATRMTFEPAEERSPVLSPDGTTLYYGSDRKGLPDIYAKEIDSAEEARLVLETEGDQTPSDLSPDGQYLLYTDVRGGSKTGADELALSLRDGRTVPVARTPANDGAGRVSPDGKWVLYVSDVSGRAEVYVKPFLRGGAARQVSTGGAVSPRWSRDGRAVLYVGEAAHTVMRADVDEAGNASEPRALFTMRDEITSFDPLADGRFVLNILDETAGSPPARVIVRWPDSLRK